MFGALAFTVLVLSGHYPPEMRAVNLDTDWFVRLPGRAFISFCHRPLQTALEKHRRVGPVHCRRVQAFPALSVNCRKGLRLGFSHGTDGPAGWLPARPSSSENGTKRAVMERHVYTDTLCRPDFGRSVRISVRLPETSMPSVLIQIVMRTAGGGRPGLTIRSRRECRLRLDHYRRSGLHDGAAR